MTRTGRAILAVLCVSSLLAGCTWPAGIAETKVNSTMTIGEAKEQTQSIERRIAAAIPAAFVERVEQNEVGVLMTCSSDIDIQWSGDTRVYLTEGTSMVEVLHAIEDDFSDAGRFVASRRDADGTPTLDIRGAKQSVWIVHGLAHDTYVVILSWSECIPLPEGMIPSDRY